LLRDGVHVDLLPMMTGVWLWFDNLWTDNQSLLDDQDGSIVVVKVGVICATGHCHQVV
jgi:hypothetical protein